MLSHNSVLNSVEAQNIAALGQRYLLDLDVIDAPEGPSMVVPFTVAQSPNDIVQVSLAEVEAVGLLNTRRMHDKANEGSAPCPRIVG